ncbi:hypothetical protein [Pantoea sp. BAV 3049]|uniref:hypothetical protein n=1 Tax=Pantoea sp. BAV 3049 TaxID=2654188 RepID=UPI0018EEDC4B|nr:hypothetical protein [Pantoea sp. BAV 3049]
MKILKITLFSLSGAICGGGLMWAVFPLIAKFFVGPVHGEDQMSLNASIFLIGFPMCTVLGALKSRERNTSGILISTHQQLRN